MSTNTGPLEIEIFLTYFNSSTAKQLLKLLMLVDEDEVDATVTWRYPNNNQLLKRRGEELAIMLDLPFSYQPQNV